MEYWFAKEKGIPQLILVSNIKKAKKLKFVQKISNPDSGNWIHKYNDFKELYIRISQ
jgi:hypothetical protein